MQSSSYSLQHTWWPSDDLPYIFYFTELGSQAMQFHSQASLHNQHCLLSRDEFVRFTQELPTCWRKGELTGELHLLILCWMHRHQGCNGECFSACINTVKEWGQHVWGASTEALVYILNWNTILSLFFNEPVISRFLALPTWNHIQHISWYLEDFVTSMIRCVWYESIQNAWDVMRKLDFIASSSWCDATQPVWRSYRSLRPLLIFHSGVGHSKPHGRNISTFRLFLFF